MAIITWENGSVPEGMEIKQVYGLIFTEDGRIMLRTEQKLDSVKFSLAGGHPEPFDDSIGTMKPDPDNGKIYGRF